MVEFEQDCFLPLNILEHPIKIGGKIFVGYAVDIKYPSLGNSDAECLLITKLRQI